MSAATILWQITAVIYLQIELIRHRWYDATLILWLILKLTIVII